MPEPFIGVEVMETVGNGKETWNFGGYNKIQKPRERYVLIDYKRLMELVTYLNS